MNKAPFTKDTLTKIAACNALGLEYWSPGPKPGMVWALDGDRQAHLVRVRVKQSTVCKAILSEPVPFEVTESAAGELARITERFGDQGPYPSTANGHQF